MNIDIKIPNKILPNWIWQCLKRIIHHNQVVFIFSRQSWFNTWKSSNIIHQINRLQNKNHVIMPTDTDGHLTKIQPIHNFKTLSKLGMKNILNLITSTKKYVNIIFNDEINTGHLLLNTENKTRISLSSFQFNVIQ